MILDPLQARKRLSKADKPTPVVGAVFRLWLDRHFYICCCPYCFVIAAGSSRGRSGQVLLIYPDCGDLFVFETDYRGNRGIDIFVRSPSPIWRWHSVAIILLDRFRAFYQ